jgi:uncharacterized delta-60 repeat protein
MFKFRSKRGKHRSAARRGWLIFFCKPAIERLEDRYLLACTTGPWCLDPAFGNNGQKDFGIYSNSRSHAVFLETVGVEQEILMGGYDVNLNPPPATQEFALARLHSDGRPDMSFGNSGIATAPFYPTNSPDNTINAVGIQQAQSSACNDTTATDKIVVAGTARPVNPVPSDRVIALMRFCANTGALDTSWGGNWQPWYNGGAGAYDPEGTVTVNITDGCGSWMRQAEGLALAIQPNDGRIVVGGHGDVSPRPIQCPAADPNNYFVVARLDTDYNCVHVAHMNPGCLDTGSFNHNDPTNPGVFFFHVGGDLDGEAHALQLVPNGSNWDILVAGRDKTTSTAPAKFAVALVNNAGSTVTWTTLIDFTVGNATQYDNVAWSLARESVLPFRIIVGGTTCPAGCSSLTSYSHFALARLLSNGAIDTTFGDAIPPNGKRVFDVDYANIGYSVVLQPQTLGDPKIVIGGYSASSITGAIPYMAGGRVLFGGTGTPDMFKSSFIGASGPDGDQARELRVQSDNKIVAAGFHTMSGGSDFAIIRLCEDPDPSTCSSGNIPSGGDRQGTQPPTAPDPGLVASITLPALAVPTDIPSPVTAVQESPAPPLPDNIAALVQSEPVHAVAPIPSSEKLDLFFTGIPDLAPMLDCPLAEVAV